MSEKVIARAYNRFQDVPFGLIRKESDTSRLADEIGYYREVQRDINKAIFFPRLIASHIGSPNWMMMEKYGYRTLGSYIIKNALVNWDRIFSSLMPILAQFETFTDPDQSKVTDYAYEMYSKKTLREYLALEQSRPDLKPLFDSPTVTLHNEEGESIYTNFPIIWRSHIKEFIEDTMLNYTSTMIHGDFCFSNILYSSETPLFKFIDPRGSFGKKGIYGDIRYDIAKLAHSIDGGYEFFINDEFDLTKLNDVEYKLIFRDPCGERSAAQKAFESNLLVGFDPKEIMVLQGCIYIGMCARHYDSPTRQEAMYLTGVRLLNEASVL